MREEWKGNGHHEPEPTPYHEGGCDRNGCSEEEKEGGRTGGQGDVECERVDRAGKMGWEIERQ